MCLFVADVNIKSKSARLPRIPCAGQAIRGFEAPAIRARVVDCVRGDTQLMAPPVGSGAPSGCSWACWKRLTAGQMLPLCSYGEQMENRSADVADGVRRSVSRPGGVRPLPRREAVA